MCQIQFKDFVLKNCSIVKHEINQLYYFLSCELYWFSYEGKAFKKPSSFCDIPYGTVRVSAFRIHRHVAHNYYNILVYRYYYGTVRF
jgi:hypothetical protein